MGRPQILKTCDRCHTPKPTAAFTYGKTYCRACSKQRVSSVAKSAAQIEIEKARIDLQLKKLEAQRMKVELQREQWEARLEAKKQRQAEKEAAASLAAQTDPRFVGLKEREAQHAAMQEHKAGLQAIFKRAYEEGKVRAAEKGERWRPPLQPWEYGYDPAEAAEYIDWLFKQPHYVEGIAKAEKKIAKQQKALRKIGAKNLDLEGMSRETIEAITKPKMPIVEEVEDEDDDAVETPQAAPSEPLPPPFEPFTKPAPTPTPGYALAEAEPQFDAEPDRHELEQFDVE